MTGRFALVFLASFALVAAGCGGGTGTSVVGSDGDAASGGGDLQQINVGLVPTLTVAPMYLGVERGFFADEGLELNFRQADSGSAILTGVVQGSNEIGFVASIPAVVAASQGTPLRIVSGATRVASGDEESTNSVLVPRDSEIRSFADLAGRTASVNSLRAYFDLCLVASADRAGIDPASVEIIELPFSQVVPSVERGQIDAGTLIEPFRTPALQSGDLRSIGDPCTYGLPDGIPTGIYVASEDMLDNQRDLVDRFVRALTRSQSYANEHQDETRAVIPTYSEITPELAAEIDLEPYHSEVEPETFGRLLDIMVRHGFISADGPTRDNAEALLP